jgi:histidinol-phosphate/aromatic aminotransferase/cobyric acid decarboxylase-like protein
VLRSLGKSHGVPGLRLGFAYSTDEALLARLRKLLPIWSLASPAEHLLELLLKSRPELAASLERTRRDREDLASVLAAVPGVVEVRSGGANFVLARLEGPPARASEIGDRLIAKHNIYVKELGGRMTPDAAWLRLAVRLPHEHRRLAAALAAVLGESTSPAAQRGVA